MRIAVIAAVACLSIVGLSEAGDAKAAMRLSTDIPAQNLGGALKALAQSRDIQVLYLSTMVRDVRTGGAVGELTTDEALTQLLSGTGLTYRYVSDKAVTILRAGAVDGVQPSTSGDPDGVGSAAKEGKKSTSTGFHTAQVDPGTTAAAGSVGAVAAESQGQSTTALQEVVVQSFRYLDVDTSGTTNLPLPIELVPQSISLVNNDFITAANLKTLSSIAEYTPGAVNVGNPANTVTAIMLRGFTPGRAVDGINIIGTSYEPDYAIFDRLEIVKGPSSVVYGISSPGGVVNFVTKSATPQTPSYLFAQAGSWHSYRLEGQIAGALDAEGHVRAIGVAVQDQGDDFVDHLYHKKTTLYAGLDFDLGSIKAYVHGGYERFERTYFDGIPTEADGTPAPLPRSFFIGVPGIAPVSNVWHGESEFNWHATDMLEFGIKGNYERANQDGAQVYSSNLTANGDISLAANTLPLWLERNYGIGVSSIYHFDNLGLKNSFVSLAALYQDSYYNQDTPTAPNNGTANIFDGEAAISQAFEALLAGPLVPYDVQTSSKVLTFSGQSVLQVIDPLNVLLGVSYSRPDVTAITNGIQQAAGTQSQVSYRAGLTYRLFQKTNAYVSYSQSFNPQPALMPDLKLLPPITGEQYEVGVKCRCGDGGLLLTGALFQIREKNVQGYASTVGAIDYYLPIGQVTHKGVELQGLGQVTPAWQMNAGYAYLNPTVDKDPNPVAVGQTQLFIPKQTASLYTTYTLQGGGLRGLSVGGGVRYVSDQRTSYDNSTKNLPGYTVVDATLGYTIDKWYIQLNAHNILNRYYFLNNYQTLFYGNRWGDPTNFALSIRRTF